MPRQPTANVRCPECNYAYSKQKSTLVTPEAYMRKRKCLSEACGRVFTTYEILAKDMSLLRHINKWIKSNEVVRDD